ncbi:MAG: phosphoribosyl-ATP diphosphatase [Clostridiales Family XIII bacterium]|jgi:phosphoribosyl-ATP pyrophosphohydrolase|nr:phosphoribosyl-ATP diphosphatase [Clostridiales Family XIII bacterium]
MPDLLKDLYEIVEQRRAEREEGSYTAYLFGAGLDKILKKVGEETSETIIAAKNLAGAKGPEAGGAREALKGEVGDLLYHLAVMLCELGVEPGEIDGLLRGRMQKTGNLKQFHQTG